MRLSLGTFGFLLRKSVVAAFDDGCFGIAKGAAYSALLSFFPVLTSAATILVQTRTPFVSNILQQALAEVVPPGAEDLVVQQFRVVGERPAALLVVAGLISLWAASSVIKSLIDGFHAAYHVPRDRGFFHQSAVAIALVLLCAVPLLGSSLLILFGGQVERVTVAWLHAGDLWTPLPWIGQMLGRLARFTVAFGATVLVNACLYYFGPFRSQRWRFVWPGAMVATSLWLLATLSFAWYVRHMAHYNVMYGSVGAGIALLVWMYLLAAVALVGCEFNAACERAARA
jgi:membrane protein